MTHTRDVPSYFLNPFPFDAICIYLIINFFLFIYFIYLRYNFQII